MMKICSNIRQALGGMKVETRAALIGGIATIIAAFIVIFPNLRTQLTSSLDEFSIIKITKPEDGAFITDSLLVIEGVGINPRLENFVEVYVQRTGGNVRKQDGKIEFFTDNSWEYRYCILAKGGGHDLWVTLVSDQKKFKSNVVHINKKSKLAPIDSLLVDKPKVPTIKITDIGERGFVAGTVSGLAASQYHLFKVIVYTLTDIWYLHPYTDSSVEIRPNGSWRIDTVNREPAPSRIAALLVDKDYQMPELTSRLTSIKYVALDTRAYPIKKILRLSGTVIDEFLNPIAGTKVTIMGKPEFTYSDSQGYFSLSLSKVESQSLRILVSKDGFQPWEQVIETSRSSITIEVRLRR